MKTFNYRMSDEMHKDLKTLAAAEGMTLHDLIVSIFLAGLQAKSKENKDLANLLKQSGL